MFAYDRLSLLSSAREEASYYIDGDGSIHFSVVVAWAGERAYPDLYPDNPRHVREQAQLECKSFLQSIDALPLTLGHPAIQVDGQDFPAFLDADGDGIPRGGTALIKPAAVKIGTLYGPVQWIERDGYRVPVKRGKVDDADVREAIISKAIREFSLGFRFLPVLADEQAPYDIRQLWDREDPAAAPEAILSAGLAKTIEAAEKINKQLGGNHGAMVPRGRAGYEYGVLGLDSRDERQNIPFYQGRTTPAGDDDHVHSLVLYKYDGTSAGGHTGPGPDGHRHVVDVQHDETGAFNGHTAEGLDRHRHRLHGRGSPRATLATDADTNSEQVYSNAKPYSERCVALIDAVEIGIDPDMPPPRLFKMIRNADETGKSGTGHVVDGVIFGDGRTVSFWRTHVPGLGHHASFEDFEAVHIGQHPANRTEVVFADADNNGNHTGKASDELPAGQNMKKRRLTLPGFAGLPALAIDNSAISPAVPPLPSHAIDMDPEVAEMLSEHVGGLSSLIATLNDRIAAMSEVIASMTGQAEETGEKMEAAEETAKDLETARDAAVQELESFKAKAKPAMEALRKDLEAKALQVAGVDALPDDVSKLGDDELVMWSARKAFEQANKQHTVLAGVDQAVRGALQNSDVPPKQPLAAPQHSGQSRLDKLQAQA